MSTGKMRKSRIWVAVTKRIQANRKNSSKISAKWSLIDFTTICRFKFELQLSKTGPIFDADFDFYPTSELFNLVPNKSNQRFKKTVSVSSTEIKPNPCNHRAWTRETNQNICRIWRGLQYIFDMTLKSQIWASGNKTDSSQSQKLVYNYPWSNLW